VTNDTLIGTTIDQRFKVQGFVGAGKSGSVYRAEDLSRQYHVALKFLQERVDEKMKERFRHGAEMASVLTHPNIVRLYSFNTTSDSRPYFVMDIVSGENLANLLSKVGKLSESQVINVFSQICDALDYAHAKGVVHRNLKPSNIILIPAPSDTFVVKIADFGVSKGIGERETRQSLARKGEMLGNPLYMSPEQCTGAKMDGRSDIYAAGCLLYEALTGNQPYSGATSFDVMNKHLNEAVPTVPESRRSSQLQAILNRALAKKPEERYQEAGEMSRDLQLMNEVPVEDWNTQAYAMRPVEVKQQKVVTETKERVPFNPMVIIKPLLIVVATLAVFIGSLIGLALADPDIPSLLKYKVAVQELIMADKDPRLLKNCQLMEAYEKSQHRYAEAWRYRERIERAKEKPLQDGAQ
jgi:serine/threonine protein kinase